jgi:hypothetical protein
MFTEKMLYTGLDTEDPTMFEVTTITFCYRTDRDAHLDGWTKDALQTCVDAPLLLSSPAPRRPDRTKFRVRPYRL